MVKIVGLGNPLYGDDAFGLHVIEELKKRNFSNKAILISLPTPSPWDIYEVLREGEFFIIVDAMESGEEGKIEIFSIKEIETILNYFKTIHDININQVLGYLMLNDINVNGIVVAVKGYNFNISLEMSEKMSSLICKVVDRIEEIVKEMK